MSWDKDKLVNFLKNFNLTVCIYYIQINLYLFEKIPNREFFEKFG